MIRLPRIMCQTVTISRYTITGYTDLNEPIKEWVDTEVNRCSLQPVKEGAPTATAENTAGGDAIVYQARLFAPAGTDISYKDRVTNPTGTYEIVGDPQHWSDSRGRPHHIEAFLKRWKG